MFSVFSVLIGSLALWLVLVALQRLLWTRNPGASAHGADNTNRMTPSASSRVVLAYAAETSEVNRHGEARR